MRLLCLVRQLFVSSSVSLSIPFTIGRIIDLFSGTAQGLPISVPTAAALMAVFFAIGAAASQSPFSIPHFDDR